MKRHALMAVALAAALATAGCGGHDGSHDAEDAAAGAATTAAHSMAASEMAAMSDGASDTTGAPARTTYPVEIEDCDGRMTTYAKAPERVITLDPSVAESLLLLGLKDRIVGLTEFQKPADHWAPTKADLERLHVVNDGTNYPSKESIVALAPDLVISVYPSALLDNETLPDRDGWKALGVDSFLTRSGCDVGKAERTDLSDLYADLRSLGVLFDVQDRAEAEIAKLEARVEAIQAKATAAGLEPQTVWTYSGEDDPFPAAGTGTANAIIRMAGATNAFGDTLEGFAEVSWEEVVKRDPDVVWLMTSAGTGYVEEAKGIVEKLEGDSRLAGVTAIKRKAYVVISYNESGMGTPRNVDGLERMVDGLIALKQA